MDEATFKERVKKLTEINKVVMKLDPAIRGQAFALLEGYVGTGKISSHKPEDSDRVDAPADTGDLDADLEAFVGGLEAEPDTPAESAKALAAFLYKRYGKAPVRPEEINELARKAGWTVPDRIDMTLKGAKINGKTLFRQEGKTYVPTVQGESFFKETYKVKRGKLPKPSGKATTP